ncbi:MAG: alpha-glucosidase [Bacteroidales bacterium]|nr:alpha-glucosidase [Bacteroidales bacterium]MBN2819480.1 alpha-glucosidase [Bacteroidales bacterium]
MTKAKLKDDFVWWKHGVIYHIYPRSFYDSNNDGIGDLQGIIQKFDYLEQLGIDAVWLSPIYKSPQLDYGYDVSDYREIDSDYGTMDDFKELLDLCHSKGIKLIMDMILNHTSDQHAWFLDSKSARNSEKRDFYIWKKKKPNNWKSAFGRSGWKYDDNTQEYYYHSFFAEQPDLNWRNPKVRKAMFNEINFWLDMGVDGFRLDVINYIVKDKKFRDDPGLLKQLLSGTKLYSRNRDKSIKIVTKLRNLIDKYDGRAIIGEIYVLPPGDSGMVSKFLGNKLDALNLAFDFSLVFSPWSARNYYNKIEKQYRLLKKGAWATILFSNHDLKRAYSRFWFKRNSLAKVKIQAALAFTFKGTPFIYYGEEIGMADTKLSKNEIKDKLGKRFWPFYKGRDGARTPMQWDDSIYAGFSLNKPWLPLNSNFQEVNIESQLHKKDSHLNYYRSLIQLRKNNRILQTGDFELVSHANNVLVFKRLFDNESLFVVLNFGRLPKICSRYSTKNIAYLTHQKKSKEEFIDRVKLRPFEGLILYNSPGFKTDNQVIS